MNSIKKLISISTFPVEKLWMVFEDKGKQYKSKIHSIVVGLRAEDENSIVLKPITTMDIRNGFIRDLSSDELVDCSNYIGIIDENDDWVELDKSKYIIKKP